MSLSSIIVERKVATMRQVEEALARQVIYGGDLATNLLEVAPVDEVALMRIIAASMGLEPAPPGELPGGPESASAVLLDMAIEREIVAIAVLPGRIVLAVVQPLPGEVERQLGTSLGVEVEQRAAPAVRVRQAMTRVYGLPLDRRMQRLVARLSGAATVGPSLEPRPLRPSVVPPPEAVTPPLGLPGARMRPASMPAPERHHTSTSFPAHRAAQPVPAAATAPPDDWASNALDRETPVVAPRRASLVQREVPSTVRTARRRHGPITLEAAKREADESSDRDALIQLFFDFSRQFFEYAALFLVHGDIAEGFDAFGTGASRERVVGIGVLLDLPGLLTRARDERLAVVARPPADGLDAVLLADLQRPRDAEVAVIPLVVRTRTVAILVGDCGEVGVDRASLAQLATAARVVGQALERIIVRRKLEGFIAAGRGTDLRPSRARGPSIDRVPSPEVADPPREPSPADRTLAEIVSRTSIPPPAMTVATVRQISGPPIPREEPDSSRPPPAPAPAPPVPSAPPVAATAVVTPADRRPALENGDVIPAELDARALFDLLGWETGAEPVEAPPPSSSFAVAAHHPPPARTSSVPALPSVIVDLEEELLTMVERLVGGSGDESAEAELLRQGDRAMRVIKERFPGPVTFERARLASAPSPPRASDCGPLLRLVARERKVALPFVLEWMSDADPDTRGWATHLVCELAYVEAIPHVLDRLRDPDACTRASALLAIAAIAKSAPDQVREAIEPLASSAEPADRVAGVRAMAALRQAAVLPEMIAALDDRDERVAAAAHDALVQATWQDVGSDAQPWLKWWEQNASRHRIEWLIDSLTHDVPEIRRGAGEELRTLTREYFGYTADLPARDRDRAQQRYRDWWLTEGRSRFRRR